MPRRKIYKIKKINAYEILDSRGNPTVQAEVVLDDGQKIKASVPSGASTGSYEAVELRDKDEKRFAGLGVQKVCKNIETKISKSLAGTDIIQQEEIDKKLIQLDNTADKSNLGANATLAVSLACCRAGAIVSSLELYKYIQNIYNLKNKNNSLPVPMFNIFNGGKHADTNLDVQEFMIVPILDTSLTEKIRIGAEIFHKLGQVLRNNYLDTDVGNEGGYAPNIDSSIQAMDLILDAIKSAGYKPGQEIALATDIGASELYNKTKKLYCFELDEHYMLRDQLISLYREWASRYPIFFIEDGLAEDDITGWQNLMQEFEKFKPLAKNQKMLIVGDDLVATNLKRLKIAREKNACNAVIVKPNQIGTLSETIDFVKYAQKHNLKTIVSHRSGETCDDFIADLAVAVTSDFVKFGSLSRGERVCKWNRLMIIDSGL
ncbi:phosphopyruvate hydratase [Patescibacteria group bacterium]|nr:phosphopyruvate hydratase [Patescibacteria group bacterium]MBU4482112.1 phosphopyruvate hydratase [Patescibacteria group bacterium]